MSNDKQTIESSKQIETQFALSSDLAQSWNNYLIVKRSTLAILPSFDLPVPKLQPLSKLPSREELNVCFHQMYNSLDEFDSPILESKLDQDEDCREIIPVVEGTTSLDPTKNRKPLDLDENIRVNYLKRSLSFFHGAFLAVQTSVTLNDIEKLEAINLLVENYNRYKDGPARKTFAEVKYEDFWGKKQANYLKSMLVRMSLILGDFKLDYKDLCAGEMVANLERKRAQAFVSRSEYTDQNHNTYNITLTETPLTAQMDSRHFEDQFAFMGLFEKNNVHYRHAPKWFQDLDIESQNKLVDAYHHKGVKDYPRSKVKHLYIELGLPISHITEPHSLYFLKNLQYLLKIPAWFRELRSPVQAYLAQQTHSEDKKHNLPSIPATLRSIPLLANMNIHRAQFKSDAYPKDNHSVEHTVYRHGVFTPYDMTNGAERRAASRANGKAFADILLPKAREKYKNFWADSVMMEGDELLHGRNIPIADISLLSPNDFMHIEERLQNKKLEKTEHLDGPDKADPYNARLEGKINQESNRSLRDENMDAYKTGLAEHVQGKQFENLSTNLGINGDRWVLSDTFNNPNYRTTIGTTIERFDEVASLVQQKRIGCQEGDTYPFRTLSDYNKFKMAQKARVQLEQMLLKFGVPYRDKNAEEYELSKLINAELFANCLHAIIIEGMGGTVSACCKSTKDRTGLFVLHLDAMHEYYLKYGEMADFQDPLQEEQGKIRRELFVDIMVNLYLGNMQQYMASQATFGSAGIKKPGGTIGKISLAPIPTDMMAALERKAPHLFERQKELADINKISFKMGIVNFFKSPSKTFENAWIWCSEKIAYHLEKLNKYWNAIFDHPKTGVEATLERASSRMDFSLDTLKKEGLKTQSVPTQEQTRSFPAPF